MSWNLKRTRQCAKCPWRQDVDPTTIPDGYTVERHAALRRTIADPDDPTPALDAPELHVMVCHETADAHCLGWLMHQLGPGNNLLVRMRALSCGNLGKVRLRGPQHATFEATVPHKKGHAL